MNRLLVTIAVLALAGQPAAPQAYRTLNDRYTVPAYTTLESWQQRATWLRDHILVSAGLLPMPEKAPLRAVIFDEKKEQDYSVSKVYFEGLPGFFVTGNLYRPAAASGQHPTANLPAILSPHGHWNYGRLENTETASVPGRAINLARQGFVVFTYDMIGYNDSRQLTHRFGGKRESLWGLTLAGLQLWNSIRAVDFLESLAEVDRARIGCTGASGGGTQTFLLAAVEPRIKAAAPVNMISLHMQGGCLCENSPGLRVDADNVELAACMAPRPLVMVSATGDWTKDTMQLEYPEMQKIYSLFGARDRVFGLQIDAGHNYNRASREAVYAWMARWLKGAPADVTLTEKGFHAPVLPDQLVFYGRPLPAGAVTAEQLTENWIASAKRQLGAAHPEVLHNALVHTLGLDLAKLANRTPQPATRISKPFLLMASDSPTFTFETPGFDVRIVRFQSYDPEAAAKINHFETYNRTPASQRVYDIVQALLEIPRPAKVFLVADGTSALAALLAQAIVPVDRAILDVGQFDNSSDAAFVECFYIPGLRRAGDFATAAFKSESDMVIHNAGNAFKLDGIRIERQKLNDAQIQALLK